MTSGMTIGVALDLLIQRYESTKARHLLTIDEYDREYQELRESIIRSFRTKGEQPPYVITDTINPWDADRILKKREKKEEKP